MALGTGQLLSFIDTVCTRRIIDNLGYWPCSALQNDD